MSAKIATVHEMAARPVRVAIEGCGHGTLHAIYASIEEASREKSWENGPDIVIIGGDFQAVRNADDLTAMSVPQKYREIGDFHEYYSGRRTAPYLTLFVGGNHEASNYLFELYHGGWVAPKIYYLGAANVLRFGPLRIAGLSGIWKGYNYRKPHYERLPYTADDVKSIYHVRELDVRKLLQIKTQIDVGLSHDWPKGIEWLGNWKQLFRFKQHFEEDARSGRLGSAAARYVLDRLRPPYWFSAHLHCKFSAVVDYSGHDTSVGEDASKAESEPVVPTNDDEIDIDLGDDDDNNDAATTTDTATKQIKASGGVSEELRAQLPDTFTKVSVRASSNAVPEGITNKTTRFLALDKCLPRRRFLQLTEISAVAAETYQTLNDEPFKFEYDPEWLAINRVYAPDLCLGDRNAHIPPNKDRAAEIGDAEKWIDEHVTQKGLLTIPSNFEQTAPIFDASQGINNAQRPCEYTNAQTATYCSLIGINNPFALSEDQRQARIDAFVDEPDSGSSRRGFGGRGRGRGRGARGRGRGFARY